MPTRSRSWIMYSSTPARKVVCRTKATCLGVGLGVGVGVGVGGRLRLRGRGRGRGSPNPARKVLCHLKGR